MTDRRRNGLILLLVAGLLAASLLVDRGEADAPRPRPQGRRRARLPGRADPAGAARSRRKRSTARSTSSARASTSSASASPRSSARAETRSRSACPTSRTSDARRSRSAPPPSCTSTTGRGTSSRPTAEPSRRSCPARSRRAAHQPGRRRSEPGPAALRRRQARVEKSADHERQTRLAARLRLLPLRQTSTDTSRVPSAPERTCCRRSTEPRYPAEQRRCSRCRRATSCCRRPRRRRTSRVPIDDSTARFYVLRDRVALSRQGHQGPAAGLQRHQPARRRVQIHRRRQVGVPRRHARDLAARHELRLPGADPRTRAPALRGRARRQTDLGRLDRPAAATRTASTARTAR